MAIREFLSGLLIEQVSFFMNQKDLQEVLEQYLSDYWGPYALYRHGQFVKLLKHEEKDAWEEKAENTSDRIVILDAAGQIAFTNGHGPRPSPPATVKMVEQATVVVHINPGVYRGIVAIYTKAGVLKEENQTPKLAFIGVYTLLTKEDAGLDHFFSGHRPELWELHKWLISEARSQDYLTSFVIRLA